MEARLQRRIQRYGWDAAAETYDATWRANMAPAHDAMFELALLQPGEAVLDVACGSGFVSLRAAALVGEPGSVTATDISGEMVRVVQERARSLALTNLTARRMEGESLDLPDDGFDAALCGLGLMYMPDPVAGLGEIRRTLRPGGRAVAAVWGERRRCAWADIFPIVDSVVQSEVCPLFFGLGNGDTLRHAYEQAGFIETASRRVETTLHYDGEADLLAAMLDGGAVALAAKRFDAETRQEVDRRFLASVAAHRRPDGRYAIPGEFVIACGRKSDKMD